MLKKSGGQTKRFASTTKRKIKIQRAAEDYDSVVFEIKMITAARAEPSQLILYLSIYSGHLIDLKRNEAAPFTR